MAYYLQSETGFCTVLHLIFMGMVSSVLGEVSTCFLLLMIRTWGSVLSWVLFLLSSLGFWISRGVFWAGRALKCFLPLISLAKCFCLHLLTTLHYSRGVLCICFFVISWNLKLLVMLYQGWKQIFDTDSFLNNLTSFHFRNFVWNQKGQVGISERDKDFKIRDCSWIFTI